MRLFFKKVEPILRDMSTALRHVGRTGEAAKVKALVNMVMNINTAGLAEGLGLGDALGLDLTMLREIFSQTGANSRVLETDGEDMQNREHSCFFSAAHAAKDSGIALDLAPRRGTRPPARGGNESAIRSHGRRGPRRTRQIRHRRTDLPRTRQEALECCCVGKVRKASLVVAGRLGASPPPSIVRTRSLENEPSTAGDCHHKA